MVELYVGVRFVVLVEGQCQLVDSAGIWSRAQGGSEDDGVFFATRLSSAAAGAAAEAGAVARYHRRDPDR